MIGDTFEKPQAPLPTTEPVSSEPNTPEATQPNPEKQTPPTEPPATLNQELATTITRIVKAEQANGKDFSNEEIELMQSMPLAELNRHLNALAEEDSTKEKKRVTKQDIHGDDGIIAKAVKDIQENPTGKGSEAFAKGTTVEQGFNSIREGELAHADFQFRKQRGLVGKELTPAQQEELNTELEKIKAGFKEQQKTLEDKAKELGMDILASGWQNMDFSTFIQTILSSEGYGHGNASIFHGGAERAGKRALTPTSFKEKIGWGSGLSAAEAQKKWMESFYYVAKHLPEAQRFKLGDIESWKHHTSRDEIMEDMKRFYTAIVTSGNPAAIVGQAFQKASEDPEAHFRNKITGDEYVGDQLMTAIEMIGTSRRDFDVFFGDVGAQRASASSTPQQKAA